MKRTLLAVTAITILGIAIGFGFYVSRNAGAPGAAVATAPEPSADPAPAARSDRPATPAPAPVRSGANAIPPAPSNDATVSSAATKEFHPGLNQAIESLLSPQTDFDQKQATWKQLR